jgi:putative toxin-antitoxin system antitoxin component (TIGR02293 family)
MSIFTYKKMNKKTENIITSISKKTGFPEKEIGKIIEEYLKTLETLEEPRPSYGTSRQHILNELRSNKKSSEILERFMKLSEMPNKTLAEQVFEISPKTLHLYRNSEKDLPVKINEHILKLEDLYKKGIELFESPEQFNHWLKSESYGLGNIKPLSLINSITGIDLVYEELGRIEFGATA